MPRDAMEVPLGSNPDLSKAIFDAFHKKASAARVTPGASVKHGVKLWLWPALVAARRLLEANKGKIALSTESDHCDFFNESMHDFLFEGFFYDQYHASRRAGMGKKAGLRGTWGFERECVARGIKPFAAFNDFAFGREDMVEWEIERGNEIYGPGTFAALPIVIKGKESEPVEDWAAYCPKYARSRYAAKEIVKLARETGDVYGTEASVLMGYNLWSSMSFRIFETTYKAMERAFDGENPPPRKFFTDKEFKEGWALLFPRKAMPDMKLVRRWVAPPDLWPEDNSADAAAGRWNDENRFKDFYYFLVHRKYGTMVFRYLFSSFDRFFDLVFVPFMAEFMQAQLKHARGLESRPGEEEVAARAEAAVRAQPPRTRSPCDTRSSSF